MAEDMAAAGPAGPDGPGGEPGAVEGTGDARVDEAIAPLGQLADVPLEDHPAIFERIHDRLREVLGQLNPGPAGSTGSAGSAGPAGGAGRPGAAGPTGTAGPAENPGSAGAP
jgi:hypothetical protein